MMHRGKNGKGGAQDVRETSRAVEKRWTVLSVEI